MSDITKVQFTRCENFLKEMRIHTVLAPQPKIDNIYYGWYDLGKTINLDNCFATVTPDLTRTFGVNTNAIDYYYGVVHMIIYNPDSYYNYFKKANKYKLKILINKFKEANKKILRIYSKLSLYDIERTLYRVKYNRSKKLIDKLIRLVKKI